MNLKDLIVTPFYICILTFIAIRIRPYVTNKQTRKYFLPALWVRFAGAIALGLIYQFYYGGGDTFNYWEHGSKWIWEAFQDDISIGLKLLASSGGTRVMDETYEYSSRIWYFRDPASYLVVRISAVLDLITLHTYTATALFFAVFSFSGLWALFSALQVKYPEASKSVFILFIPSVIFWGSGILKDTVTLGVIGWMTWVLFRWIHFKKYDVLTIIVFVLAFYLVFTIKKYILVCFIPMIAVWVFFNNLRKVKNLMLKLLIVPVLFLLFGTSGFLALQQVVKEDEKYALDQIAERAQITAYDIRYGWGARNGGDGGYDIGLPDGSWQSMLRLMPAAINVSLFRPYLWEVRNPLMLLSAMEAIVFLVFTLQMVRKRRLMVFKNDPFIIFCLGFSLLFAFAVGVSTFNFGTLMRYKIPMMPFYLFALMQVESK